jgi:SLOG family YspA-like protein
MTPDDQHRLLVSGWRFWPTARRSIVVDALDEYLAKVWHQLAGQPLIVVHGAAPGVDTFADQWARACEAATPEPHPADWARCTPDCLTGRHRRRNRRGEEYCPDAGTRRNARMVELGADWLLAFPGPDPRSGTSHAIRLAQHAGIGIDIHPYPGPPHAHK